MAVIKHLFHIDAPRQKVYEALATRDGLTSWWTTNITGSSDIGNTLAFRFGNVGPDFKVTGLNPATEVSWECTAGFDDWVGTTISFLLDENENKTRIRFSHDGWRETGDGYAACTFSWSRYLESLRQYCQTGKGASFGGK